MLSAEQKIRLVSILQSCEGKSVVVEEYMIRGRDGYNRHFGTRSRYVFTVSKFWFALSGFQLTIESEGGENSCGLSLDCIAAFEEGDNHISITEHFEQTTTRQTIVRWRTETPPATP